MARSSAGSHEPPSSTCTELVEMDWGFSSSLRRRASGSLRSVDDSEDQMPSAFGEDRRREDDELELQLAAIERLPTFQRLRTVVLDHEVVDVAKLAESERRVFVDGLLKTIEEDNLRLLQKLRQRVQRALASTMSDEKASSVRIEASEIDQGRSWSFSSTLHRPASSSFRSIADSEGQTESPFGENRRREDDELELQWAAIERLPTFRRLRAAVLNHKVVDVAKLGDSERRVFVEGLLEKIEEDNLRLLQKLRERVKRHILAP